MSYLEEMFSLKGKTAIVTGAGRGGRRRCGRPGVPAVTPRTAGG